MFRWHIHLGLAALMILGLVAHPPAVLAEGALFIEVRSGPGATYEVVAKMLPVGSIVAIGQEQDWYKIQLSDGRQGWVHRTALQQEPPTRPPPEAVSMPAIPPP